MRPASTTESKGASDKAWNSGRPDWCEHVDRLRMAEPWQEATSPSALPHRHVTRVGEATGALGGGVQQFVTQIVPLAVRLQHRHQPAPVADAAAQVTAA